MKVFTLTAARGEPRYCQALQVDYWFWERGYEVVSFTRDELQRGLLDEDLLQNPEQTIVYGAVGIVHMALARVGRPKPPNIDFPASLAAYLGRRVFDATMGEVRSWQDENSGQLPAHIKPRDRQKLFKGAVVEDFADLIPLSGVPDDEPVIVQEVVQFVSEWRATVLRDRIVNVAHYKGDPLKFPDPSVISQALAKFADRPIACGLDWGITADGRTLLVEVNDGYALGNYGVRGHQYTAVIECRWRELMGLEDNGVGWEV